MDDANTVEFFVSVNDLFEDGLSFAFWEYLPVPKQFSNVFSLAELRHNVEIIFTPDHCFKFEEVLCFQCFNFF